MSNRERHRKLRGNILISAATVMFGCAAVASSILLLKSTPAAKPAPGAAVKTVSSSQASSSSAGLHQASSQDASQSSIQGSQSPAPAKSLVSLDNALFIGDAFVDGLRIYGGIDGLETICDNNMSAYSALNRKYTIGGKSRKVADAAAEKNPGAIYILLGTNDIAQGYSAARYAEFYGEFIDDLKSRCPNAKIYVQSVFPVTAAYDGKRLALNNEAVEKFNAALSKLCESKGVAYLDVASALKGSDGCLPKDASADGVHLKKAYYKKWVSYLESNG